MVATSVSLLVSIVVNAPLKAVCWSIKNGLRCAFTRSVAGSVCGGIGATAVPSGALASASAFRALASFMRRSREFREGTTERSESIVSNSDYMAGSVNALAQGESLGRIYFTNLPQSSGKVFPKAFEGFGSVGCCRRKTGCEVFVGAFREGCIKGAVEGLSKGSGAESRGRFLGWWTGRRRGS